MLLVAVTLTLAGCGGETRSSTSEVTVAQGGADTDEPLEPVEDWEPLLADVQTCPNQRSLDATTEALEQAARCLVDEIRRERDLEALAAVDILHESARAKAADVVRCNEFSHTACGTDVREAFERAGYGDGCRSWRVGENLGLGERQAGTPRSVVLGWLRSPGHRRNLLGDQWREQGMALIQQDSWSRTVDGDQQELANVRIWVNHFGARSSC